MQLDLADLLARCHAGDELAWEAFVRRFQGRIYSIAYSYAGNPDDARDLAQDIFVRLYSNRRVATWRSIFSVAVAREPLQQRLDSTPPPS
jgi:DNA-directed RNA polymerase specialized sigma24 family protein